MRVLRGVLLLFLCAAAAWCADISGQWKAEWSEMRGPAKQSIFTFKQDGTALTGTLKSEDSELAIRQGKVSGEDVSFVVANKIGNRELAMTYTGKISGNEIKFALSFEGAGRTWDLTATKVQ